MIREGFCFWDVVKSIPKNALSELLLFLPFKMLDCFIHVYEPKKPYFFCILFFGKCQKQN